MASPPLLHHGRSKLSSCVQQPVALRPRVGQTLPSGRQCYSAVTSPIMSCKSCASSLRPASTIPGYLRVESPRQINPVCADFPLFIAFFIRWMKIVENFENFINPISSNFTYFYHVINPRVLFSCFHCFKESLSGPNFALWTAMLCSSDKLDNVM